MDDLTFSLCFLFPSQPVTETSLPGQAGVGQTPAPFLSPPIGSARSESSRRGLGNTSGSMRQNVSEKTAASEQSSAAVAPALASPTPKHHHSHQHHHHHQQKQQRQSPPRVHASSDGHVSDPAAPAAHGGAVAAAYVTVERTGQEVVESIDFVCDYLLMTVRGSLAGGSLPLEGSGACLTPLFPLASLSGLSLPAR